ncbi:MAG: DNA gyrase subunit A, partial [Kiritimatiellae bacterium]|nr:DNA gyrase subunit A [Kiritimatiellia bacterium]
FPETQLRDQGRATRGVKGITLKENDRVKNMEIVDENATFLTCTENGYGKRTSFEEYRHQKRGGKGLIAIKASERNGMVVGAHAVQETDALMLITANGKMIRIAVNDMDVIGRSTQGVRLINLTKGDKLVSATTVEPEDSGMIEETPENIDHSGITDPTD